MARLRRKLACEVLVLGRRRRSSLVRIIWWGRLLVESRRRISRSVGLRPWVLSIRMKMRRSLREVC